MAVGTITKGSQELKLLLYHEITMGNAGLNSGALRYQLPILSPPTIIDTISPLESTPQIIGSYMGDSEHSNHNRTNQIHEISFSVLCTPTVLDLLCQFMFEDGDGANSIKGNYSPPSWLNQVDTDYSATIDIGGGGFESAKPDMRYAGCIAKSLTINHAIDSEAGKPTAEIVFVTGYLPHYHDEVTNGFDGENDPTILTGEGATNFIDWGTNTGVYMNSTHYEVHPYSYSVSIERDIQRVGNVDFTNFRPDGYLMQGGWDISMNMVYKRDEKFEYFRDALYDGGEGYITVGDDSSSPFVATLWGKISEHSVDTGNPELRNSITVKGMRDSGTSGDVLILSM